MYLIRKTFIIFAQNNPTILIFKRILGFNAQNNSKLPWTVSVIVFLVVLHSPLSSAPEIGLPGTSTLNSTLYNLVPNKEVSWDTWDLLLWKMRKGDAHLLDKKGEFIA